MRAQRRTVIVPMYGEDAEVINVSRIIMVSPGGLKIAKSSCKKKLSRKSAATNLMLGHSQVCFDLIVGCLNKLFFTMLEQINH